MQDFVIWRDARVQAVLQLEEDVVRRAVQRASAGYRRELGALTTIHQVGHALAEGSEPDWESLLGSFSSCVRHDESGDTAADVDAATSLELRFEVLAWISMAALGAQQESWREWCRLAVNAARDARDDALEFTTVGGRAYRQQAWCIAAWIESSRLRLSRILDSPVTQLDPRFVRSRLLDRRVREHLLEIVNPVSQHALEFVRARRTAEFPYHRLFSRRRQKPTIEVPGGTLADVFEWALFQTVLEQGWPCMSRTWRIVVDDWPSDMLDDWHPRTAADYSSRGASNRDGDRLAARVPSIEVSQERLNSCSKFWSMVVLDNEFFAPLFRPRRMRSSYGAISYLGQSDSSHVWVSDVHHSRPRWIIYMDAPGVPCAEDVLDAAEVEEKWIAALPRVRSAIQRAARLKNNSDPKCFLATPGDGAWEGDFELARRDVTILRAGAPAFQVRLWPTTDHPAKFGWRTDRHVLVTVWQHGAVRASIGSFLMNENELSDVPESPEPHPEQLPLVRHPTRRERCRAWAAERLRRLDVAVDSATPLGSTRELLRGDGADGWVHWVDRRLVEADRGPRIDECPPYPYEPTCHLWFRVADGSGAPADRRLRVDESLRRARTWLHAVGHADDVWRAARDEYVTRGAFETRRWYREYDWNQPDLLELAGDGSVVRARYFFDLHGGDHVLLHSEDDGATFVCSRVAGVASRESGEVSAPEPATPRVERARTWVTDLLAMSDSSGEFVRTELDRSPRLRFALPGGTGVWISPEALEPAPESGWSVDVGPIGDDGELISARDVRPSIEDAAYALQDLLDEWSGLYDEAESAGDPETLEDPSGAWRPEPDIWWRDHATGQLSLLFFPPVGPGAHVALHFDADGSPGEFEVVGPRHRPVPPA